jgi:hypothetical protein
MLDSLVRVSRRGEENHLVQINNLQRNNNPLQGANRNNTTSSAPTASNRGSAEWFTLVSFASFSAISGTL